MKGLSVFIVFALLVGSGLVVAAEGPTDAQVAAAVQADQQQKKGFAGERIADIQGRLDPFGNDFRPDTEVKDGPQGPLPLGPGYGGGQGGYIERNGGPDYSERDSVGPRGPNDRDLDQSPDYGPSDFGQPGYGPQGRGPSFGPQDYRAFGGFEGLSDDPAFVGFGVFKLIGEKMMQKYGEENLKAKCDNQPELVDLVLSEFQQSGLDLNKEFCSEIKNGLEYCEEGKKQCEMIGNPEFGGPRFGPPGEEEAFSFSCPPDKAQILSACKSRMEKEFSRGFSEREQDLDDDCEVRWEFEQGHFSQQCEGGQIRLPEFCSKDKFISQCLERSSGYEQPYPGQPPEGQPGQPPYGDYNKGQPQPIQRQCPSGPQLPQAWYDNCQSTGGFAEKQTDRNGCVFNIVCKYGQTTPPTSSPYPQTGKYCPSDAERQQAKNTCTGGGGTWSENSHDGCIYVQCQGASGTTPYPSPTAWPSPTAGSYPSPTAWPSPTSGPTCPSLDEAYKQSCLSGGGTVSTVQQSGCTYYQCQYPTAPSPTAWPSPTAGPYPSPSGEPYPSPTAWPSPTTQAQVASSPFTAFITGQISASERCEQEWQQQQPRFERECSRMQQQGPQFNPCSKDSFVAFCRQEQQKYMQKERERIDFGRICELESKRMLRDLERYCKDTGRGKEQCLKETERGCEFGRKQLARCEELTQPDQIRPAVEKAVARGCREFARSPDPDKLRDFERRASKLQEIRDLVPPSLQPLLDFESDNVAETDENLQKVNQKDVLYALTQIIGLQAEQERKDAELIKEQSERLAGTIERLKQLREQVDDANAAAILDAQILDLEQQQVSLGARAESKEQGASGILSFLSNLFGGGNR
ncbi:hypothetical protein HY572_01190 [Candidatus Micrarchaeota archaeon]|nr:hypothetical protein [Candidatus Micrarchaeota archaeon]